MRLFERNLTHIIPDDVESIRLLGFEHGHDAKRAAAYIPNPYTPCTPAFEAYRDGYDLGVMAAKVDMAAEEKVLTISNYAVDTH